MCNTDSDSVGWLWCVDCDMLECDPRACMNAGDSVGVCYVARYTGLWTMWDADSYSVGVCECDLWACVIGSDNVGICYGLWTM